MVLPATSYWTLRKAIVNPSTLEVLQATHRGEVATWEKLSAIQVNCAIEKALDQCHSLVASRLKKQHSLGGMKSRIPSWLHMPVLGEEGLVSQAFITFDLLFGQEGVLWFFAASVAL